VLSTAQVIGGTIVLIGIIIAETARSQPPPPT